MVVVEGYVDVIPDGGRGLRPHRRPARHGAHRTPSSNCSWRLAEEPILCFDGDKAGPRAAWRAVDLALPQSKPGPFGAIRAAARRARIRTTSSASPGRAAMAEILTAAAAARRDDLDARGRAGRSQGTPERRAAFEARAPRHRPLRWRRDGAPPLRAGAARNGHAPFGGDQAAARREWPMRGGAGQRGRPEGPADPRYVPTFRMQATPVSSALQQLKGRPVAGLRGGRCW